jgi:hypothetical protein
MIFWYDIKSADKAKMKKNDELFLRELCLDSRLWNLAIMSVSAKN